MSRSSPRLDPGHWITLGGIAVQAVAIIAVVIWRVGAVEARVETLDRRLWDLTRAGPVAGAVVGPTCPADATAVRLTSHLDPEGAP